MKEYMKMSCAFDYRVTGKDIAGMARGGLTNSLELAAYAINSHDELVEEVERLRGSLLQCVEALHIAHKFCGNHTAEECGDEIAIPISDALVAASKLVAP